MGPRALARVRELAELLYKQRLPRRHDGTASGCRRPGSHGVEMFTESLCGICAISEISVGFWRTRRCQTTPGRSHFIIGPVSAAGSSAFPKADADRAGAARARRFRRWTPCGATAIAPGEQWHLCSSFAASGLRGKGFSASHHIGAGFAGQMVPGNPRRTFFHHGDHGGVRQPRTTYGLPAGPMQPLS